MFDYIAACSKGCGAAFAEKNSALAKKVNLVYNCHDFKNIRQKPIGYSEGHGRITQNIPFLPIGVIIWSV